MAVTHIVPRAAAGITLSIAHNTPRPGRLDTPRDGGDAVSQLGRDIRTNGAADDDDGEDGAILTRRPTRRDGARDGALGPLGLADPPVPIASINADVDALDGQEEVRCRGRKRVRARAATTCLSPSARTDESPRARVNNVYPLPQRRVLPYNARRSHLVARRGPTE